MTRRILGVYMIYKFSYDNIYVHKLFGIDGMSWLDRHIKYLTQYYNVYQNHALHGDI